LLLELVGSPFHALNAVPGGVTDFCETFDLKTQATEIDLSDGPWRKVVLKEIVQENAVTDAKTPRQDDGENMDASIDGAKEGSS
jgi:hypothetical protein